MTRREVLRRLAVMTGGLSLLPWRALAGTAESARPVADALGPTLPRRVLGKTGLHVSMLTIGGSHIGRPSEADAQAIIEGAIELGVRTFETAQLYQNGGSEERLGKFLTPKYREHVQLFTKTMAEDAATARRHLEDSLRRLRTDVIDLWQLHDVRSAEQAERRVAGVLDVMLRAKAEGKVRHIGFSGHATWRAHARVLELTDQFETCLMPINVADPSYESFILNILPKLTARNMGVLAMKTLGGDGLTGRRGKPGVIPDVLSVADALRFAWSLPIHTLVSGIARVQHLRENVETARTFVPLSPEERAALVDKVRPFAADGALEYYKFDR
ncbi:MAG: aldo/keto reductase [Opitutaceae bacterium]|nr:aldo/keto reductase [Opitutaceae bacterium]